MKQSIRKEALARRGAIPEIKRTEKSRAIKDLALQLPEVTQGRVITIYVDYRNEVETRELITALLHMGKVVALPIAHFDTGELTFIAIDSLDSLIQTEKRLWEPASGSGSDIPIREIDLILTPGAAFDRRGYRLGYGGGFYDRLLEKRRPDVKAIALSFSEQLVEALPAEAHDQKLDGIITEMGIIRF